MRRRMKFTAIILGMTLAVCGCQGGAEQQTETKQDGSQTAGDTENSTEEATDTEELSDNAAAQESDVLQEEQEEIQVSLEGVAITRPDNWEVLSFDELTGKAMYGIEQDGTVHEVTLYTMDDVALHGNTVTDEVAANVAFSYDSEDASQTVSFPTTEFLCRM